MSEGTTVLNPMAYPPKIEQLGMASRPPTLKGRTVYLVDCRFDDGDILMRQMAGWFSDNMPDVNVEVRRKSDVYTKRDDGLYDEIRERGHAAVIGVGH